MSSLKDLEKVHKVKSVGDSLWGMYELYVPLIMICTFEEDQASRQIYGST